MFKNFLVLFIFCSVAIAQDIVDIPAGTKFRFNMSDILKKQAECVASGDDYRIKNQVHFINGKVECNGPIFERSCYVEFTENSNYSSQEICKLDCVQKGSHRIELKFENGNCPILKCRPLMWTAVFTGTDIGTKSMKYNLGGFVEFTVQEGINQSGKSTLDKVPFFNKAIIKNSEQSVQEQ